MLECLPELLNLVSRREIRRRRRGWAKRKAQLPATAVACCVSMIGDTVKALRRTREDAAALALKLAEVQTAEVKDFKAAASAMRSHVDLLRSEVKVPFLHSTVTRFWKPAVSIASTSNSE